MKIKGCQLRIGDDVVIITGSRRGQLSKITAFKGVENNIFVTLEGVNVKRAMKKNRNGPGKFVDKNVLIDASNVAPVCTQTKKRLKISFEHVDGKMSRVLKEK